MARERLVLGVTSNPSSGRSVLRVVIARVVGSLIWRNKFQERSSIFSLPDLCVLLKSDFLSWPHLLCTCQNTSTLAAFSTELCKRSLSLSLSKPKGTPIPMTFQIRNNNNPLNDKYSFEKINSYYFSPKNTQEPFYTLLYYEFMVINYTCSIVLW